jgi:hypothetical protein
VHGPGNPELAGFALEQRAIRTVARERELDVASLTSQARQGLEQDR